MEIRTLDIHRQLTMARLPALPQVLLELLALCDRDDVGIAEIGATVARDTAIAGRIVSVANSPYYRPGRPLESIDQCLAVLGTGTIRRLALNQCVVDLFSRFQKTREYDLRYFWFHGLTVAVTARGLAERFGYANPEEAYLAGLLHDVGQLALLSVAADRYAPMFRDFSGEHRLMRQEQEAFGLTHAEVGAWLAQRWHLHALFVDSLLYHHEPAARLRDAHPLVRIVMLANRLNVLPEPETADLDDDLAHWRLAADDARALVGNAQAEARAIAAELGIEIPSAPAPAEADADPNATLELARAAGERLESRTALPEAGIDDLDPDSVRAELRRAATLLFGARACALFEPEDQKLRWRGMPGDDPRLSEISVDAEGETAVARAARGHMAVAGNGGQPANPADAQIARVLGAERLLCLPLAHAGQTLGALVLGLDAARLAGLVGRQALIATFAREAGGRLGLAIEHAARERARVDALGEHQELAARKLAHEAGNPLGVIRNYLSILRRQLETRAETGQAFDLIEEELRRVTRLIQDFRMTPAADAMSPTAPVDINTIIDEVARFCRLGKAAERGVEITLLPTPSLPPISTNADKLKQILTTLIFNAVEALPGPGQGRVTLASTLWRDGRGGDSIELSVSDNGPGIPDAVLAKLYQPVTSDKGEGHAGLGLAIVAGLIEELGGTMQCRSDSGGTHFKLLLPVAGRA
jgi:HD-like signal output (HDOD) protein/two-component sensor histidine kinase